MKRISGLPLDLIGAMPILAPPGTHALTSSIDRERVAAFNRTNPNNALFPRALEPSDNAAYEWAYFGIGAAVLFTGVRERACVKSAKPEAWERAEV